MRRLIPLLLLLVLAAGPASATASVPDPARSFVDTCLVVCPYGDIPFTVQVFDLGGNPVAGSFVLVQFCDATDVHLCPPPGPIACSVGAITDGYGIVTFAIEAGGVTSGSQVARIYADGVLLATRPVASPDQDGNLIVSGSDQPLLAAKVGTLDRSGMITCNLIGGVTQSDLDIQKAHMGHACGAVVAAKPKSWGSVKQIYR
jgi:hypothetical protein